MLAQTDQSSTRSKESELEYSVYQRRVNDFIYFYNPCFKHSSPDIKMHRKDLKISLLHILRVLAPIIFQLHAFQFQILRWELNSSM